MLGNATTEVFNGVISKINGKGTIDFVKLNKILLFLLMLYIISFIFNYLSGLLTAKISWKYTEDLRRRINRKTEKLC